ncbi:MAG: hypothetical protein KIT84_04635 [Labilithrix sp.]|nr:hypothetical protein [Labilithrix sp.]MCW5810273.1 hypothetical protein [Labilithrix sp.]
MASGADGSRPPARGGVRSRICLSCRTLFDHGEDCRGKGHQTVSIVSRAGRTKLFDEVWGPDSRARAVRNAAKAGAGGAASGSALDYCNGCDVLDACSAGDAGVGGIMALIVIVVAAAVGVILYWLIRTIVRFVRDRMHEPQPHGALYAAPKPKKVVAAARGVVRGGELLDTPWREGSAYGWSMELHERRVLGGGAMMRDARTAGFDVTLEDGRTLRVPPGRIRVLGTLARVDAEVAKLEGLVAEIDRARMSERTVFPFDYARALTIEEGDHVEVIGELTHSADTAAGMGYRANAGLMEPVGIPFLRVEKAARVRVMSAPPPVLEEAEAEAEAEEAAARER